MSEISQDLADRLLDYWQRTLGMQDWHIEIRPNTIPCDMKMTDVSGETVWVESNREALIRILREDCYGDCITPFRFEKTLIHELLHLKFCLLGESGNDLQDRYVHQLIDDLARALYMARSNEDLRESAAEKLYSSLMEGSGKTTPGGGK